MRWFYQRIFFILQDTHFFICFKRVAIAMRNFEDSYRHKGLRKNLISALKKKGISNEAVLEAMNEIPRHFFLDTAFDSIAYEDRAFPIGEGQTISQPYTVAYQTQLLEIKPYEKIWSFYSR